MSDEPGGTPEQHVQAAFDHLARAARQWVTQTRQALEPVIGRLGGLASGPDAQAGLRRRAKEDLDVVAPACDCRCATVHPGSRVCDVKAVTTIRRSGRAGQVSVPVCAPCAAEVMAQQL